MPASLKAPTEFDVAAVRADFPILASQSRGKPLVYLDNGATTQKPKAVIAALRRYYETQNANIHRGVYELSQIATEGYEGARRTVAKFINAAEPAEVLFTRGTTEGINLVASSFGRAFLHAGDEVFVSALEHHSNIVPWQMICQQTGAVLRVIPMNDAGELLLDQFAGMVSSRTKLVAVTHLSNSLGTVVPVEQVIAIARSVGAKVLVDGAQWVAHAPTDVRALDADFYVFSGHKIFAPTGTGVLYGKRALLDAMPPWQGGGDMIEQVTFGRTTYAQLPNKFEAGTPNIGGAIGLAAAIDYVSAVGLDAVRTHERDLHGYLNERVAAVDGVRLIGTAAKKASVVSFVLDRGVKIGSHDAGVMLDLEGIAIRTGHHCCQPVMDRFGIPGTARASVAMYNTRQDVDRLTEALEKIVHVSKKKVVAKPDTAPLRFPAPSAATVDAAAASLLEDFELFDAAEDRYAYVMELGEKIPPMPDALKTELTRVHGCMSVVHLHARKRPGTTDGIDFIADSDGLIVKGLIAVLQRLFAGQSSREMLGFDVERFLTRLGLGDQLTQQRRTGLAGMVSRLRAHANQFSTVS